MIDVGIMAGAFKAFRNGILNKAYNLDLCKVVRVDEEQRECEVEVMGSGLKISGINLGATQGEAVRAYTVPAVDSFVWVMWINDRKDGMVVVVDTPERQVWQKTEGKEKVLEINFKEATFTINDGKNDGMVIVSKLVTEHNKLVSKFNALLTALQGLVMPAPVVPVSTAAKTVTSATAMKATDIKNDKAKH